MAKLFFTDSRDNFHFGTIPVNIKFDKDQEKVLEDVIEENDESHSDFEETLFITNLNSLETLKILDFLEKEGQN